LEKDSSPSKDSPIKSKRKSKALLKNTLDSDSHKEKDKDKSKKKKKDKD